MDKWRLLENYLDFYRERNRIPGLQVAILDPETENFSYCAGKKGLSRGPLNGDERYRVASISKHFTAQALLKLLQKDERGLDAELGEFLDTEIDSTLREILSHTAGLKVNSSGTEWTDKKFPSRDQLNEELDSALVNPDRDFKYSNLGYALLGLLIKDLSGMEPERYIEEEILNYYGSEASFNDPSDVTGAGRDIPERERERFDFIDARGFSTAAGLTASKSDLKNYLQSYLRGDMTIPEHLEREMRRPHSRSMDETDREYGLGTEILELSGKRFFGHTGGFFGQQTLAIANRESETGLIILSNSQDTDLIDLASAVLRIHDMEGSESSRTGVEGLYRSIWGECLVGKIGGELRIADPTTELQPIGKLEKESQNVYRIREFVPRWEGEKLRYLPGEEAFVVAGQKYEKRNV